jgi:hypothetical protein
VIGALQGTVLEATISLLDLFEIDQYQVALAVVVGVEWSWIAEFETGIIQELDE